MMHALASCEWQRKVHHAKRLCSPHSGRVHISSDLSRMMRIGHFDFQNFHLPGYPIFHCARQRTWINAQIFKIARHPTPALLILTAPVACFRLTRTSGSLEFFNMKMIGKLHLSVGIIHTQDISGFNHEHFYHCFNLELCFLLNGLGS